MHIAMPLWLFAGVLGMAGATGALLGDLICTARMAVAKKHKPEKR